MPSKKKTEPTSNTSQLSFEEALARIEEIVDSMESEELPLEDLVAQYEAGSALLKHCDTVLASARDRIALITLNNRQDNTSEPSEETSQNSPAKPAGDPDDNNDISLF